MDNFYATAAWAMFSFIAGAGIGGYLMRHLSTGSGPRVAPWRQHFEWARRDVRIAPPSEHTKSIRLISDWENAPQLDTNDGTLTFHIQGADGLEYNLPYKPWQLLKFFKCDTPKHDEYRGDHNEFTKLLGVARHYGWVHPRGRRGYEWGHTHATRERRLRLLALMVTTEDTPPRA